MPVLDQKSRELLNALQAGLPLAERPFKLLGQKCGLDEEEVLARTGWLKEDGTIREISAIFDTRSLGYESCLAACQVPPEKLDAAAAVLSQHPGVTHNYARNHAFNLWFTLAVPPGSDLNAHAGVLRKTSGADSIRLLPALRVFKIGVKLDMTVGEESLATESAVGVVPMGPAAREREDRQALTEQDKRCVRALQKDLALRPEPFAATATEAGLSTGALFDWCRESLRLGRLRRIAGVLRHRVAGFLGNGMGAWNVPPERVEELGAFFAAQAAVTHCYQRPQYPDWPYNVFTMVHARTVEECGALITSLARQAGIEQYAVLYSTKEYKKTRLRYFTGDVKAWEEVHGLHTA